MVDIKILRHVFEPLSSDKKFIVHCGGSGSGKTTTICQWLVLEALKRPGLRIDIFRKALTNVRRTTFETLQRVMTEMGAWSEDRFNSTTGRYEFNNGSRIQLAGCDDPQKLRGMERDIAWLNEANEMSREDFKQIAMRSEEKVILDYNPSDGHSWIYELEDQRADEVEFCRSTFEDNAQLSESRKQEIRQLQFTDLESWKVYGLGLRGAVAGLVYPGYVTTTSFPSDCETVTYGLDFGYNDPSAMVRVGFRGLDLFVEELMYDQGMTSSEIASRVSAFVGRSHVYADSAEPDKILDLSRAGVRVHPARKDILAGITAVKSFRINVVGDSPNLERELGLYRWKKDVNGNRVDTPVGPDHLMDAMRYAVYNTSRRGGGKLERGDVMWI